MQLVSLKNIYKFLTAVSTFTEEYYEGPMRQIDGLLNEVKQNILTAINWTETFKVVVLVRQFHVYPPQFR